MMKWLGAVLIALGLFLLGRGLVRWNDPPLRNPKYYYGTSQQLVDVCSGVILATSGVLAYRTGRLPR
jgi:hypothetical protein